MSLRGYRKNRRPGNRPMTEEESVHVTACRDGFCVPCLVRALLGLMPLQYVALKVTYDHKKSGNIRIGHMAGFGSCLWHHQGYLPDGWTGREMRDFFGPSLMDGSNLFRETYGDNPFLIEVQAEVLKLEPELALRKQDLTALRALVARMESERCAAAPD